jgi:hypothetical protein
MQAQGLMGGQRLDRLADRSHVELTEHGIRQVRDVVTMGMRRGRPDALRLQPVPQLPDRPVGQRVEDQADAYLHGVEVNPAGKPGGFTSTEEGDRLRRG